MNEDKLREAFTKIREDMNFFYQEIETIKRTLEELKEEIKNQTQNAQISNTPTHILTHPYPQEALKTSNLPISTGNDGVPTHHPTNQQTNQQTLQHPPISTENNNFYEKSQYIYTGNTKNEEKNTQKQQIRENSEKTPKIDRISRLQQVSQILQSLDELKKEVRIKFKKLTNQEMLIYSTIYQLDQLQLEVDYSLIAEKLNLSDTSIRDYVRKIISKGVPLDKTKENNKKILLKIPENFKRVASLNTILELREL